MDSKAESYGVVYEDIEPFFEWHTDDDDFHVLLVMLPGFRTDQLKVQVTSTPILKISAQRQIGGNRWRRVYKEFSLPSDCDPNDITAQFEAGTLKIKFQKLIITPSSKSPEREGDAAEKNDGPRLEDQPKPKKSDDQDQVYDKSQKVQESTAARHDNLTKGKGKTDDGVGEEKAVHQEKAKSSGDEDSGKTSPKEKEPEAAAASDDFSKEKGEINNGVDKKKAVPQQDQEKSKSSADEVSREKPEAKQKEKEPSAAVAEADEGKQRTKNVSRLKTRLLDFTLSLRRPSSRADQQENSSYDYKEPLGDLVARLKKMKNLINMMMGALLVVALVLYLKNITFKPSPLEGSEGQDL